MPTSLTQIMSLNNTTRRFWIDLSARVEHSLLLLFGMDHGALLAKAGVLQKSHSQIQSTHTVITTTASKPTTKIIQKTYTCKNHKAANQSLVDVSVDILTGETLLVQKK